MAAATIAPSLPAMAEVFSGVPASETLVRLALTVTSLTIAITAPFAGALADRIGRRPLLIASLVLYTVAGSAGFFVSDLPLLLASRALLGVAVGGIMTAVSAIITDWFEGPARASFLARQQAAASLGGVIFLPLAGVLAAQSWRAPFLLYGAGILVLPFVILALREPDRARVSPLVAGGIAADGSRASGGAGWRIAGIAAVALVVTAVFFMAPTQLPFSLQRFDAPPAVTGVVVAASTATGVIGALGFPWLSRRLSATAITASSVLLLGMGWVLVGTANGVVQVLAGVLLGGIGVGMAVPNLNYRLAALATPAGRGRVLGTLVAAIFLGQFLSPLVAAPLIDAVGIPATFLSSGVILTVAAVGVCGSRMLAGRRTPATS